MLNSVLAASDLRIAAALFVVLSYLAFCVRIGRSYRRHASVTPTSSDSTPTATLVAYASQTGFAQQLAQQTATSMRSTGQPVALTSLHDTEPGELASAQRVLFVVSTTGEGDAPDPAANFVRSMSHPTTARQSSPLQQLRYAILALGDREYDNFCAFGHRLDAWLRHQGATPLFDVVEVDNGDESALRHWQHQLGVLAGTPDLPDWDTPRYERWRLVARELLNPGSAGLPCFRLKFEPRDSTVTWHAGDIAEVDPRNSTWNAATVEALPHREYSIASIVAEGTLELLVRQMRRPDGAAGLGSGWLTEDASLHSDIALRIRSNPNFHPPLDARPLILIGNGTGLAGLRALLKARVAAHQHRNWLLFGERNASTDYFYRDEIERWQQEGSIEKLDLVFSRDQLQREYVQHRVLARAEQLREWLSAGAAIFVCGSLEGMAPGVDAALRQVLGSDTLEGLLEEGRYRRDVY